MAIDDDRIARMAHIHHPGLMVGDPLLNLFDQVEPVERIEAVVGQILQLYAL
ncbi:hypothetical protein KBY71_12500 [Cyanobium sp. T1B-Tous]|uniref:hypothetical protein n=1 Tax=Cyanobium sp. T1B-Tous TaxID=2823721 RepID=UPI0020CF0C91|nr:hypothetical protein [Cyanobium sp. T1B-Tous]MCP9807332.1 hypothetical protein [Cyanobium sp. T1B-Tous]